MESKTYYYVYSNNSNLGYVLNNVCESYESAVIILSSVKDGFIKKHTDTLVKSECTNIECNQHFEIRLIESHKDVYYTGKRYYSYNEAIKDAERLSKESNYKYEVHLITEDII